MKFFLTVFMLCAVFNYIEADSDRDQFRAIAEECKDETGATDDDITAMFKHEALTTTEAKCMRACALRKGGLLDEDGNFNKDTFMQLIKVLGKGDEEKEKLAKEIIDECTEIELPEDHCEAAEEFAACLRKAGAEKGLSSMEME